MGEAHVLCSGSSEGCVWGRQMSYERAAIRASSVRVGESWDGNRGERGMGWVLGGRQLEQNKR